MHWLEDVVFLALVVGLARPVGHYLARVFERKPTFLDAALRPAESLLYRLLGVHSSRALGSISQPVKELCSTFVPTENTRRFGRSVNSS